MKSTVNNNVFFQNILTTTLLLGVAIGCNKVTSENTETSTTQSSFIDPCTLALIAHSGTDKIDLDIQKIQQKLNKTPNNVAILEKLGWAYVEKASISFDPGYYKLAEQSVNCIEQKQPELLDNKLLQGHIFHQMHRFKDAEQLAHQLVAERGRWYDYGLLGDTLMEQGELVAAIPAYQEMMNQNPGSQAYNRAANIRWLTGDLEGAIELLKLSLSIQAGQINVNHAWTVTRLASIEFQNKQIESSLHHLLGLLHQQPDYAPALLLLGRIKLYEGEYLQAIKLLSQAQKINPLPEYSWTLLEALSTTDDLNKQHSIKHQLLTTGAAEDRRTFALYLASSAQSIEQSIFLIEQELLQRKDVFTLDAYAWALYASDRKQDALVYSNQVLKLGTQDARLYYHAGVISHANALYNDACQLFRHAKSLEHTLLPSERKHLHQFL